MRSNAAMDEFKLKIATAYFVIISHFAILILIFAYFLAGGFTFEEMTTAWGIISPLFAGYTTIVFAFMNRARIKRSVQMKELELFYVISAFIAPFLFVLGLSACVFLKAHNIGFEDFEEFKTMIGIIQTAFGVYVGQFINSLFESDARSVRKRMEKNTG